VPLTVYLTVHGPIMTQAGQTMAVDWMGNVPSADLGALLGVAEASNFGQFKAALASWHAPTQNFVYADARGHIGVISAGYYPQVAHGDPWLPLPGPVRTTSTVSFRIRRSRRCTIRPGMSSRPPTSGRSAVLPVLRRYQR